MKKQWMVLAAVMAALSITACGSGDGIMINGTTAAEAASDELGTGDAAGQETTSGTKIEIVTGETTTAVETAPESTEGYTQAPVSQTQAETAAQTAAATQAATKAAAQPETTAAKVYKVTDMKKTMYATASVRVRASYSTSSDVLAGLSKDEKVEVTGQSENGWLRVNYKGNVGYVSKDYLTEKAPQSATSQNNSNAAANTGTAQGGTGTNPSGTTGSATGPTAGNSGITSGQTDGPGSGSTGNSNTAGSSAVGPGGATSPSGTTQGGNTSSSGTGNSVTGSVTALDPSGVTVQTSNGTTYQFVWGNDVPALAPGDKIQINYETTSSGQKRVTSYSK